MGRSQRKYSEEEKEEIKILYNKSNDIKEKNFFYV